MELLRLAFLHFEPPLKDDELFGKVSINDVSVKTDAVWKDSSGMVAHQLVAATLILEEPLQRNSNGQVVIPSPKIREAERAIELTADLMAVAKGCKRSISSPRAFSVGLIPGDETELNWLKESTGIENDNRLTVAVTRHHQFDMDATSLAALYDRIDGVQLLAEALSHEHATGRFHELLRFFERAFTRSPGPLVRPLADFLKEAPHNFTAREVQRWIDLRGPATHADRRPEFLLESEVRPVTDRMEFAAYDVLLHKQVWRSASSARRRLNSPETAQTADSWGPLHNLSRGYTLIDAYGAWPILLVGPEIELRPEWWAKRSAGKVEMKVTDSFEAPFEDPY